MIEKGVSLILMMAASCDLLSTALAEADLNHLPRATMYLDDFPTAADTTVVNKNGDTFEVHLRLGTRKDGVFTIPGSYYRHLEVYNISDQRMLPSELDISVLKNSRLLFHKKVGREIFRKLLNQYHDIKSVRFIQYYESSRTIDFWVDATVPFTVYGAMLLLQFDEQGNYRVNAEKDYKWTLPPY